MPRRLIGVRIDPGSLKASESFGRAAISSTSALVGQARAVAPEHLRRAPAGEAHQVALLAAAGEPLVGERVSELVSVEALQAGRPAAPGDELRQSRGRQRPVLTDPEGRGVRARVSPPEAPVAVDSDSSSASEEKPGDARLCP
jgi:hypothetical protein